MVLERGQVAVEAALVMPLMVFFTLGIIQLATVQQARLMTEYAAYQAARAGIVWNGSNERMHDAAVIALLPTMGKTRDMGELYGTWVKHNATDLMLQGQPWGVPRTKVNGQSLVGQVRIDTITPSLATNAFTYWNSNIPGEIDFDGVGSFPENDSVESHYVSKFFNLSRQDPPEDEYRAATLLQIRLRYWYEMKIPFANQVIFLAWYAANADVSLYGAIDRSSTTRQNMLGKSGDSSSVAARANGIWDPSNKGFTPVRPSEMQVVWNLAMSGDRRYFFPLQATHSMRMQSNFYRKWRVH